jgi:phosphoenolpyruvate carboxylase
MARQGIFFPLKDAALREDVHMLGGLVGEVIRDQAGDTLYEAVEGDRLAAIARRNGDSAGTADLQKRTRDLDPETALDLVRAFSTWFQMVNMAEKVHRIRRRRQYFNDGSVPQPGGIEETLVKLKAKGLALSDVHKLLQQLWIEPVLTAHPTESTRRTILRKQQHVAELLLQRLDLATGTADGRVAWGRVRAEITSGWQTADNSRERLTVADEREHVLFFLVEVLYKIIPFFYEEIEVTLEKIYGPEARDLDVAEIIRFGTWVGGDMHDNPDVHAKTIRETMARQQQLIVNSYFLECQQLAELLSQSASRIEVLPELQARIETYMVLLPGAPSLSPARHDRMPYRVFLGLIAERLRATYDARQNQYESAAQLLDDLRLIATSLERNKGRNAGLFQVRRLIRRVRTFGFHLATLDVRQQATVHRAVIANGLGDEQWLTRPVAERTARVREALERDEGPSNLLDASGKRALWVFEALAHCRHRYGPDALGPYVVSMAEGVDDILSVLTLARWADTADRRTGDVALDVTPAFATSEALGSCGEVMRQLFCEPVYQRHLAGRANHQFVMISHAACNKEEGVFTSHWLMRRAQEALVAAATEAKVDLTIFYGRAGATSRSASRPDTLIRSAPAGAVNGRLRLTEQGESINDKYGLRPIALRVFEQMFSSLTSTTARVTPPERVLPQWRQGMEFMSAHGQRALHALIHERADFADFFRSVTPIDVIERMQIGSRPVTRTDRNDIASLRAVPWSYAWAQCRYMLPSWYGAGTALATASRELGEDLLSEMYAHWFFFENLIDEVELALARADLDIASYYDELVDAQFKQPAALIREEYELAKSHVLKLKGCARLLDAEPTIQRSIKLRSPYLDPIHLIQVDLLKRWRASGREDRDLLGALLASVNGVSQGLQGAL